MAVRHAGGHEGVGGQLAGLGDGVDDVLAVHQHRKGAAHGVGLLHGLAVEQRLFTLKLA